MPATRSASRLVRAAVLAGALLAAPAFAATAPTAAAPAAATASPLASGHVGTLKFERHGQHGQPVILIPGLQGGPWVWQDTIADLERHHVVYAVTLAGFDGMPAPANRSDLMGQASASLLRLIDEQHIERPVLVGHSLGGTLALRFAGEHPQRIAGVVAVDGLPVFPGLDQVDPAQRQAIAAAGAAKMANLDQAQFAAYAETYMRHVGVIDPALASRYAPLNARSDIAASAAYAGEVLAADYRPGLAAAKLPILELMPFNAADAAASPELADEAAKLALYRRLLESAPQARVQAIAPTRHYLMLDQPAAFRAALNAFLSHL